MGNGVEYLFTEKEADLLEIADKLHRYDESISTLIYGHWYREVKRLNESISDNAQQLQRACQKSSYNFSFTKPQDEVTSGPREIVTLAHPELERSLQDLRKQRKYLKSQNYPRFMIRAKVIGVGNALGSHCDSVRSLQKDQEDDSKSPNLLEGHPAGDLERSEELLRLLESVWEFTKKWESDIREKWKMGESPEIEKNLISNLAELGDKRSFFQETVTTTVYGELSTINVPSTLLESHEILSKQLSAIKSSIEAGSYSPKEVREFLEGLRGLEDSIRTFAVVDSSEGQ